MANNTGTEPRRRLKGNGHMFKRAGIYYAQFKVNGKRKTPVVLFLNKELLELSRWVERPNAVYKLINESNGNEDLYSELRKIYSDPEILRQSFTELMGLLLRADFLLGRK